MARRIPWPHLIFVRAYLTNGHHIRDAYAEAYPCASRQSCHSAGSNLINSNRIRKLIKRHQDKVINASVIKIEQKRQALWEIVRCGMEPVGDNKRMRSPVAAVKALTELNRMDGHHLEVERKRNYPSQRPAARSG